MATNYEDSARGEWCVCSKAHQSFCLEGATCRWGAAWPDPYEPIQSMEDTPWMTTTQAGRAEVYRLQRLAVVKAVVP